jgi:hypothetical protein
MTRILERKCNSGGDRGLPWVRELDSATKSENHGLNSENHGFNLGERTLVFHSKSTGSLKTTQIPIASLKFLIVAALVMIFARLWHQVIDGWLIV